MCRLGHFESAFDDYSRALELFPNHLSTLTNRAIGMQSFVQYFSELIVRYLILVRGIGLVLDRLNRCQESIADLTQALDIDPNSITTLVARARLYSKQGDIAAALDDYNAADGLQPQDPAILFGRGIWCVLNAYLMLAIYIQHRTIVEYL